MVYLYALLGVTMMSGIMAIFEMGLSLTGQSMIPVPPDEYFADPSMQLSDVKLLENMADTAFPDLVLNKGLCGALEDVSPGGWTLIGQGRWANSCQLNRGAHRVIVRQDPGNQQLPYQLFSCALSGGNNRCTFESE